MWHGFKKKYFNTDTDSKDDDQKRRGMTGGSASSQVSPSPGVVKSEMKAEKYRSATPHVSHRDVPTGSSHETRRTRTQSDEGMSGTSPASTSPFSSLTATPESPSLLASVTHSPSGSPLLSSQPITGAGSAPSPSPLILSTPRTKRRQAKLLRHWDIKVTADVVRSSLTPPSMTVGSEGSLEVPSPARTGESQRRARRERGGNGSSLSGSRRHLSSIVVDPTMTAPRALMSSRPSGETPSVETAPDVSIVLVTPDMTGASEARSRGRALSQPKQEAKARKSYLPPVQHPSNSADAKLFASSSAPEPGMRRGRFAPLDGSRALRLGDAKSSAMLFTGSSPRGARGGVSTLHSPRRRMPGQTADMIGREQDRSLAPIAQPVTQDPSGSVTALPPSHGWLPTL
ncbi:hypothetical protein BH10PSE19_BH10PSE19_15580 [soil metagenome]